MINAIQLVSAVLKAVARGTIESDLGCELAEVSIDAVSEKYTAEIDRFLKGKKSQIDQILNREKMADMNIPENCIDFVIAEIKCLLAETEFTDDLFRQCRYSEEKLYDYLWINYRKLRHSSVEYQDSIKKGIWIVAGEAIALFFESDDFSRKLLAHIDETAADIADEMKNVSVCMKERFNVLDEKSDLILEQVRRTDIGRENKESDKKFQNNKKQDYIRIWNSRLFLHLDNDENPLTLADTFIMPDYIERQAVRRIGFSGKKDTLDKIIERFVNYDKTSTMLIAGVPGIGKSSITAWMANKYKDDDRVIVLRFRDWKRIVLEKSLLQIICNKLNCEEPDLENKILILDGFDEMKALNARHKLLNTLFSDIKDFENFKCIVTSRIGYIEASQFNNVFELKEFDMKRIEIFVKKISGNDLNGREKIELNLPVLGIPVILYMAVMSHIDISENPTKPELYDRIFAEKGGIFDRFYDGEAGYSEGSQILREAENIKKYLKFLQKTAFKMFRKDDLSLEPDECRIPELIFQDKPVSILEFPLKHLFENSGSKIEFIHKSVYEYFVAEHIFRSVDQVLDKEGKTEIRLAGMLGTLLKEGMLSNEIMEFLKYRIKRSRLRSEFYLMKEVFQLMLRDGMTYYTNENYKNVIGCELRVFANMLEFMHIWNGEITLTNTSYLNYNIEYKLNLRGMNLSGANLRGADLQEVDFKNSDLEGTIFKRADLRRANLQGAVLNGADLRGADLRSAAMTGAVLKGADLRGAILDEAQVKWLKEKCNVRDVRVCMKDSGEIVSYDDYLKRGRRQHSTV